MNQTFQWPVAKHFFLTKGAAASETKKGAMQKALIKAGIQQANIIEVSSVLDPEAVELENYDKKQIPHAAISFVVFAHQSGSKGENIAAGVGVAWMRTKDGVRKAYVVEASGHKSESEVKKEIMISLVEIAEAESLQIVPRSGGEPLLGRKEWVKAMSAAGKTFEGFKTPERDYLKYLIENADKYFKMSVDGIAPILDDYGYATGALVYVFTKEEF